MTPEEIRLIARELADLLKPVIVELLGNLENGLITQTLLATAIGGIIAISTTVIGILWKKLNDKEKENTDLQVEFRNKILSIIAYEKGEKDG